MKLGCIFLMALAIMAVPVLGDTITFATAPATGELTWNNISSISYGQTPPGWIFDADESHGYVEWYWL